MCPLLFSVDICNQLWHFIEVLALLPWMKLNLSFNQFHFISYHNRIQHIPEEINTSNQELRHLAVSQCGLQKIPSLSELHSTILKVELGSTLTNGHVFTFDLQHWQNCTLLIVAQTRLVRYQSHSR